MKVSKALLLAIILPILMNSCMSYKVSEKSIDKPLSSSKKYNEEGLKYANEGDYEKALECFNNSINEDPKNAKALNNRGLIYQDKGLFKEALADYEEAVKISPDSYIVYANMSMVCVLLEDYKKAIEYADKSIALDSKSNYLAYENRSIAYGLLKQHDKAIADCNRAIDINPQEVSGICQYFETLFFWNLTKKFIGQESLSPRFLVCWCSVVFRCLVLFCQNNCYTDGIASPFCEGIAMTLCG